MIGWALFFLVAAIMAGLLGFGVAAGLVAAIAQALFLVFLLLFIGVMMLEQRGLT